LRPEVLQWGQVISVLSRRIYSRWGGCDGCGTTKTHAPCTLGSCTWRRRSQFSTYSGCCMAKAYIHEPQLIHQMMPGGAWLCRNQKCTFTQF